MIGLLSGAAIGSVWGWLLGSCAFAKLRRPIWTGVIGLTSACFIAVLVEILASRSALLPFFVAIAVMLPIRAAYGR